MIALARQADISLSLPNHGLENKTSLGLTGAYSTEQALESVLANSGFAYQRVGDRAFRVFPVERRASAPPPAQNDEIIVTAARRPEGLGGLPRALTHVDSAQLAQAGALVDGDLVRLAGGLSFTNLGDGRDKIFLRGISDGSLSGSTQSLVGLYFDDTRLTYAAPDPDLLLVDISSIDVLSGPQGALYGAGTIGGILRIQSNPVDLHAFSGSVQASAESTRGGRAGGNLSLVVNAPIIPGRIGLRGVFYDQHIAGWLDNDALGRADTNATDRLGGRVQLLARLNSSWSFTITGVQQSITTADSQYVDEEASGIRNANLLEPHDNDFAMLNATLHGSTRLGAITSSTSYISHELDSRFDVTGQFAALGLNPALPRPLDRSDGLHVLVHETRLSSPDDARWPWFVGIFFADGDTARDVTVRDGAFGAWPSTAYSEHRVDGIDEAAVFGEISWRLSPTLSLSTGLRLFHSGLSTHSATTEPILGLHSEMSGRLSNTGVAPDLRLAFQPSRQMLFFLSAAEGYRSGGINSGGPIGSPFGPSQPLPRYDGDKIWTYEAGARIAAFNGRLNLQGVAFLNDWHNVQTDSLFANGFTYSGNVGDARAFGFQIDARYALTDNLSLQAHALINEPELAHINPSFPDASRGALPGSPEYSGAASIRYEAQARIASAPATWFAQLDASYNGGTVLGFGQGQSIGDNLDVSARLGITTGHWAATLYGENLTSSNEPTFSIGNPYQPGRVFETPLRPLTIGLSLRRTF